MALTVTATTPQSGDVWGRQKVRIVTVTFDATYPAGGESFVPADVGLSSFTYVGISPDSAAGSEGIVFQFDYTANKIQAYVEEAVAAGGPLVENAVADISTAKIRVLCVGH